MSGGYNFPVPGLKAIFQAQVQVKYGPTVDYVNKNMRKRVLVILNKNRNSKGSNKEVMYMDGQLIIVMIQSKSIKDML